MKQFNLSQSNGDTAYIRFPGMEFREINTIKKSFRLNSFVEDRLDFDVTVHVGEDGKIVGVEILGD